MDDKSKWESAILALIECETREEAAKKAGISRTTLWRWMADPEFDKQYKEARRVMMQQNIASLQRATDAASKTLIDVAKDGSAPASARVTAAKSIWEMAIKTWENEDIVERLNKLEELANQEDVRN